MNRLRIPAVTAIAASLLVPLPPPAHATNPAAVDGAEAYSGSFLLALAPNEAEDRIAEAISEATGRMGPLRRSIARRRLRARNQVIHYVRIGFSEEKIAIRLDNVTFIAPDDGALVDVVLPDGERVQLSHRMTNGRVVQRFVGEDGERTNTFVFDSDGRVLAMRTRVRSGQLPSDVEYRLTYRSVR